MPKSTDFIPWDGPFTDDLAAALTARQEEVARAKTAALPKHRVVWPPQESTILRALHRQNPELTRVELAILYLQHVVSGGGFEPTEEQVVVKIKNEVQGQKKRAGE
ncbi:hypothetical protein HDV00_007560 [Rhizophlyctis rosea]|nr:hypothetical protein HDV00_007560 [Rhizophlyctis rosea]